MSDDLQFKALLESIQSREQEMIDCVASWAAINSGSSNTEGLRVMAERLENFMSRLPGELEKIQLPNGTALRLTCRKHAEKRVFLSGHMDTVYSVDHSFQTCERLDENRLRGPGVADMKGGLLVMLEALRAFEAVNENPGLGWEILISPDEEIGSPGSAPLLEEAAQRCQLGLIFEPAIQGSGDLSRQRLGSATYQLTASGRSAHAGRDFTQGRNAIAGLSAAIVQLHALNQKHNVVCNVGSIEGGGPVNVVPDEASAMLNFRVAETAVVDRAILEVTESIKADYDVALSWKGGFTRQPKRLTSAIEALFADYQACAERLGFQLGWRDTGGCCDGNNLAAAGLPNLDNLGVRGGNIHSAEEFVELDSLVERTQLTALFLLNHARSSGRGRDQLR